MPMMLMPMMLRLMLLAPIKNGPFDRLQGTYSPATPWGAFLPHDDLILLGLDIAPAYFSRAQTPSKVLYIVLRSGARGRVSGPTRGSHLGLGFPLAQASMYHVVRVFCHLTM